MTARVSWISLTPVKATMLHLVDEADLRESGVLGDRRFYFVTERGRLVSNKDHGPLQLVRAEYDAESDALSLRFPDGDVVEGEVGRGAEIETVFHKRPRTARLVVGPGRTRCPTPWASLFDSSSRSCLRRTEAAAARRRCSRRRRSSASPNSSASTRSTAAASA